MKSIIFFERMKDISAYTKGYLDGIMRAKNEGLWRVFYTAVIKT